MKDGNKKEKWICKKVKLWKKIKRKKEFKIGRKRDRDREDEKEEFGIENKRVKEKDSRGSY